VKEDCLRISKWTCIKNV